jgi:ABC-type dipeptide/oligopeptide/nickel transport system permease component
VAEALPATLLLAAAALLIEYGVGTALGVAAAPGWPTSESTWSCRP